MASMQIYPTLHMVNTKGVDVTNAAVTAALPPELRTAERVLIQDDGSVFIGINPAIPYTLTPGAELVALVEAIAPVASAIQARVIAITALQQSEHTAAVTAAKAATHTMAIIAKKSGMTYWIPTMPGYETQFMDPGAGDRMYSRAMDAERDGYVPGVPFPETP